MRGVALKRSERDRRTAYTELDAFQVAHRPDATIQLRARSQRRTTVAALSAWIGVIVVGHVLLERIQARGANVKLDAAPLAGAFDLRLNARIAVPVATACVIVLLGLRVARRVAWPTLLVLVACAAVAWAISLALIDGWHALSRPLEYRGEYLNDIARIGSPGKFLSTFVERIRQYHVHVQGHPPGLVLVLWALHRLGLGGSDWGAALFIGGGALAAPATLVAARDVAGERWARRAAPFVVLAPVAIWIASTADAFFAGVSAWAVALVVLATGRHDRRGEALAVIGGALFGIAAFLSYGLVLLAAVPVAVAVWRRRVRPLALSAGGAALVFVAFLASGFSWLDGFRATRARYFAGVGSHRPYVAFLVADVAALAIAAGPAVAVAIARLRDRRMWLILGGVLGAVALAALSGLARGEVERIWVPFTVWLLVAGGVFAATSARSARGWLVVQATAALVVTTVVRTPW